MIKFKNQTWLALACWILIIRTFVWIYLKSIGGLGLGNGNDSNYYHLAATGEVDVFTSAWPIVLRGLSQAGLYDRDLVSLVLFIIASVLLPVLFLKIIDGNSTPLKKDAKWISVFLILTYPTIFFFSLDLYRDIVIYTLSVISFLLAKSIIETRYTFRRILLASIYVVVSYVCFLFRDYFGVAIISTLVTFYLYANSSKYFKSWVIVYFTCLILLLLSGALDQLLIYRGVDGFEQGGATFGIGLYGKDPLTFLALFLLSFFYQMFGLYLVNFPTVFAFFSESIFFIFALVYVVKNRAYMDSHSKYLMVFFVTYSTIWVLGNDNLGTAVRLRVPSYLAIYAIAFIIQYRKNNLIRTPN
ncbi:hypothetical protein J6J08_06055 [Pseudidiomarina sp. 1APR75-33.1]|uniref:hypothetical protein n=1 Tax=Pseudidiomarina terrestris TaxID=2820060 RepID=UPI00265500B1|nr:hypothetical protein [Pseudidiomarina sp. 1APR75-33.1]MDN7126938.1 hypothetical protein [Pseudidiomarina sp. 1APR75-33.1]